MKKTNIFKSIPKNLKEELFEELLLGNNFRVEKIVSNGNTSPESGWYDQETNEWVIVLKGEAILAFEGSEDVYLKEGDYINIDSHVKHRVKWTTPLKETVWLAIHY